VTEPSDGFAFWHAASEALPRDPRTCTVADLDVLVDIGAGLQAHALDLIGRLASLQARADHGANPEAVEAERAELERLKARGDRASHLWRTYTDRAALALGQTPLATSGRKEQR